MPLYLYHLIIFLAACGSMYAIEGSALMAQPRHFARAGVIALVMLAMHYPNAAIAVG